MIVVIGAEKGGVGKSTTAVNQSAWVAKEGGDVLLVDTDKMGSSQQWAAGRSEELPRVPCVGVRGLGTAKEIRELAKKYEHIVVDAGGHDSPELRAAMSVADLIVTPCAPGQFDIFSAFTMDRLVETARLNNEKLRALMLPNLCPTNTGAELADMLLALADLKHYEMSPVHLYNRKAYRLCALDCRAVFEFGSKIDVKAVAETVALAELIWRKA